MNIIETQNLTKSYLFTAYKENRVCNFKYAAFCGRGTALYSCNGKNVKNQSQYCNEGIYAPLSKRFDCFFQKRTLFCN